MVYQEKFIVAVQTADGRTLRDRDNIVMLPFGCEYVIMLRNLDAQRAGVRVSVDDIDVLDGHRIVMSPNTTHELLGFMRGDAVRQRFKFIQKTEQIAEHRGDRLDDGLIRIEYAFELPKPTTIHVHHEYIHHYHPRPLPQPYPGYPILPTITWSVNAGDSGFSTAVPPGAGNIYSSSTDASSENLSISRAISPDEGITVPGNDTYVHYTSTYLGSTGPSHVIVIKLKGTSDLGVAIEAPITTRDKRVCKTCGHSNSSDHKFCSECGTNLNV